MSEDEYSRLLKQFPIELGNAIEELKRQGMTHSQIIYEIKKRMREYFDEEIIDKIIEVIKI